MTSQALLRILLALLLLASQQLASLHVLSHLGGTIGQPGAAQTLPEERLASVLAQDEACSHCLAFAQLGGPLGSSPPAFMLPVPGASPVTVAAAHPAGARLILAFHSRGPPQA